MKRADLPHFRFPPINEVVMGVKFAPIEGLLLTHFGLFWSTLRDEFDTSEEVAPLGSAEELPPMTHGGTILPRSWLIHNDPQYLIQLQPNIFYFNWRQLDEAQEYPRYSKIKPLFHKYLQRYIEFLKEEELQFPKSVVCDISYVNIIPEGQYDEPNGLSSLFPDACWRQKKGRFLPLPSGLNWNTVFDLPDEAGRLTAKIQSAKRKTDERRVFRFEINVRSKGSGLPLGEIEGWFNRAHEAIVLSFVDLTGEKIQREVWKQIDDAD